jgi:hypothetical protein
MKFHSLLILLLILISLPPAYYANRLLRNLLRPRQSLFHLILYMLMAFGFVFIYTLFWVWMILHLFPVSIK